MSAGKSPNGSPNHCISQYPIATYLKLHDFVVEAPTPSPNSSLAQPLSALGPVFSNLSPTCVNAWGWSQPLSLSPHSNGLASFAQIPWAITNSLPHRKKPHPETLPSTTREQPSTAAQVVPVPGFSRGNSCPPLRLDTLDPYLNNRGPVAHPRA